MDAHRQQISGAERFTTNIHRSNFSFWPYDLNAQEIDSPHSALRYGQRMYDLVAYKWFFCESYHLWHPKKVLRG